AGPRRRSGSRSPVWSKVRLGLVQDRPDLDWIDVGEGHVRGDLVRALFALAVEQVEAGDVLLGLQVGSVGHGRLAVLPAYQPGLDLIGQPVGADELAGRPVLAVERVLPGDGLRPLVGRYRGPLLLVSVDQHQVLHWCSLRCRMYPAASHGA